MFTAATTPASAAPPPAPPPPTPKSDDQRRRDDYDRPSRRGRYDDGEDDDREYDDVRRRRDRRDYAPHRGSLILVLGVLSLLACALLGPFAWVMANTDLREMHAGRMDPAGEGQTRGGQVCGMIATIFLILAAVGFCFRIAMINRH